mmetsp:Transcript_43676/g.78534  ORF Transcript_43676/g.78534 Transcript_43676/m.78534 type:complete len:82 (-) Transcript_43676:640-885(-)
MISWLIVEIAYWLPTQPRRSDMPGELISFLFSLALTAPDRLEASADKNAAHAKLISPAEAKQTPPITGMRLSHFARLTTVP